MKTKLQELLKKNRGLKEKIHERGKIDLATIKKASVWVSVNFSSKFKIYIALLELQIIDSSMKTLDLFEPIEK